MKRIPKTKRYPNYASYAADLAAGVYGGMAIDITFAHDEQCSPASGCRCDPEVLVQPLTVESVMAGTSATRAWARSKRN